MMTIADWLSQVGMHEYAQCFAENGIELDILSELTDQDLEKIGVTTLCARLPISKRPRKSRQHLRLPLRRLRRGPPIRPNAGKSP